MDSTYHYRNKAAYHPYFKIFFHFYKNVSYHWKNNCPNKHKDIHEHCKGFERKLSGTADTTLFSIIMQQRYLTYIKASYPQLKKTTAF